MLLLNMSFGKKSTSKAYLTRPRALPYRMQAD